MSLLEVEHQLHLYIHEEVYEIGGMIGSFWPLSLVSVCDFNLNYPYSCVHHCSTDKVC